MLLVIVLLFLAALLVVRHCIRAGGLHWSLPHVDLAPGQLNGRHIAFTGGTSGLGLAAVEALVAAGAHVTVGSLNDVETARLRRTVPSDRVEVVPLDVRSAESVEAFVAALGPSTDTLVYSAGVSGHVATMVAVNFLGPIRIVRAMLRRFTGVRYIIVASDSHEIGRFDPSDFDLQRRFGDLKPSILSFWPTMRAYGTTKLMALMYFHAWRRGPQQLLSDSTFSFVQPGAVFTPMGEESISSAVALKCVQFFKFFFFKSALQGAQTILHLCSVHKVTPSFGAWANNAPWRFWNPQIQNVDACQQVYEMTNKVIL